MAIILKNSWNVPPVRWGSFEDVQYAIKVNAEKVYGVDPDTFVFIVFGFWGLPLLDYSGKKNHGINANTLYKDRVLDFNGSSAVVTILDKSSLQLGTGDFTIYTHFKADVISYGPSNQGTLISKNYEGFELFIYQGVLKAYVGGTPNDVEGPAVSINTWYKGILRRSGTELNIYLDGVAGGSPATNSANASNIGQDVILGNRTATANYFDGSMVDSWISNIAFTEDQILKLKDLPYGLYQKVPRPFYLLPTATPPGWTGEIIGITNPTEILGRATSGISEVNGI